MMSFEKIGATLSCLYRASLTPACGVTLPVLFQALVLFFGVVGGLRLMVSLQRFKGDDDGADV
jgi:hypothetical protein